MTLRDDIIRELNSGPGGLSYWMTADRILNLIRTRRSEIRDAIVSGWWGNTNNPAGEAADRVIELLCGDDTDD